MIGIMLAPDLDIGERSLYPKPAEGHQAWYTTWGIGRDREKSQLLYHTTVMNNVASDACHENDDINTN